MIKSKKHFCRPVLARWRTMELNRNLRYGREGADVRALKERLLELGCYAPGHHRADEQPLRRGHTRGGARVSA
jgi:hypothetical protein